uniref:Uncharacterized protein n=2 Tax=viral metagenome TaxID=1070528 RepID=A0A6M3K2Z2_9ZZZZ
MKKEILLFTFFALLSAFLVYAASSVYIEGLSPEDEYYWTVNGTNLTFEINCTPWYNKNITNGTIWTNVSSTWKANYSNSTQSDSIGAEVFYRIKDADMMFTNIGTVGTYATIKWGIACYENGTNVSYSENRTIHYTQAMIISDLIPLTNYYSDDNVVKIQYSANASLNTEIYCELYTNSTGINNSLWGIAATHASTRDNLTNFNYTFLDDSSTLWQLVCYDGTAKHFKKYTENRTIHTIGTTITPALVKPSDIYSNNGTDLGINMTCTGDYLDRGFLYLDGELNTSTEGISTGVQFIVQNLTVPDGTYNITVGCNNSDGVKYNASKFILIVDTSTPAINTLTNYTIYDCNTFAINVTHDEEINTSTIQYGLHTKTLSSTDSDSSGKTSSIHYINFSYFTESKFEINYTVEDNAGNKNHTIFNITAPVGLCEGWNVYTVYDSINMSDLETQLVGSDYIYWWNATSQAWIYKANGTATQGSTLLSLNSVVFIYTSGDYLWHRTNTKTNSPIIIDNSSNFLPAVNTQAFAKWFNTSFKNITLGNMTDEGYQFSFDDIASWNNTGKKWVNGYHSFAWENQTYVGKLANTSLDAVWTYSHNYKVTYNTTDNCIDRNWTYQGG